MSDNNNRVCDLMTQLETGVREVFTSENYPQYLKTMSKFHNYSFHNTMLIARTNPHATMVAGCNKWKSLGRTIKKGEKGIPILVPVPRKSKTAGKVKIIPMFRVIDVFDVSQTEGRPIPRMAEDLLGDAERNEILIDAFAQAKPFPTMMEETQAESVEYAICAYYGFKTDADSLEHIVNWSADKSVSERIRMLAVIQQTVSEMVTKIDALYEQHVAEKYQVLQLVESDVVEVARIYQDVGYYKEKQADMVVQHAADLAQSVNDTLFDQQVKQKRRSMPVSAQTNLLEDALQDFTDNRIRALQARHAKWHTQPAEPIPFGRIEYVNPRGVILERCSFHNLMDFQYAAHDANRNDIAINVYYYPVPARQRINREYFEQMKNVKFVREERGILKKLPQESIRDRMQSIEQKMKQEQPKPTREKSKGRER